MTTLDWITDPHLDHLPSVTTLIKFVNKLHRRDSDGLIITGDIGESSSIHQFLEILAGAYQRPIYFVLGNHDYYGASRSSTHALVRDVCKSVPAGTLNWMPDAGPVFVTKKTALVGDGGIYDAKLGQSGMIFNMSDFFGPKGITDLVDKFRISARDLLQELDSWATESSAKIALQARRAIYNNAKEIIILTHVPPFLEASYFRGKPSDRKSRPFYVNKTLGDSLLKLASENPKVSFKCLAGHTHGKRDYQAAKNLVVRVGNARYGQLPTFQTPLVLR